MGSVEGRGKERGHGGRKWAHMGPDSADSMNRQLKDASLLLVSLNIATNVVGVHPRVLECVCSRMGVFLV